jgi:hypothetical protein
MAAPAEKKSFPNFAAQMSFQALEVRRLFERLHQALRCHNLFTLTSL